MLDYTSIRAENPSIHKKICVLDLPIFSTSSCKMLEYPFSSVLTQLPEQMRGPYKCKFIRTSIIKSFVLQVRLGFFEIFTWFVNRDL